MMARLVDAIAERGASRDRVRRDRVRRDGPEHADLARATRIGGATRLLPAVLACWLASGCLNMNFDPPYRVQSPRILAIVAEPPEVAFGEDVLFEALVVDEDGSDLRDAPGVELRFSVCLSAREILNASGLGFGAGLEDNCAEGGDDLVRLETGGELPPGTARLPGESFGALVNELASLGAGGSGGGGGGGAPPVDPALLATLGGVIAEVGVPLRVRFEVWRDGELLLTGFKRFAISQREQPTTNPPAPRFAIGERWLSARGGGDARACVPEDGGEVAVVVAGTELTLAPDPDEEPWLESYPVVALDATVQTGQESAYYSWFSTGGAFDESITQRPERDVTWTAPDEAGRYPLWLVVRDGHLGTSYCRAEIEVVPAE
jgi:hypothetical protein